MQSVEYAYASGTLYEHIERWILMQSLVYTYRALYIHVNKCTRKGVS